MRTHDYILELYKREIDALERAKGHIIGFTEAAIQIGAFRRGFNRHGGMPPFRKSTAYYLGRKRSLRTGIPNPYADVFYAGSTESTFASAITTERTSKLPKLYHWAPPLKTVFYTNPFEGPLSVLDLRTGSRCRRGLNPLPRLLRRGFEGLPISPFRRGV